jgi:hypothetical protein
VTSAATGSQRFTSSTCNAASAVAGNPNGIQSPSTVVIPVGSDCGTQSQIFPVTGVETLIAQPYALDKTGACVPSSDAWQDEQYLTYGAEVAPSTYPQITGD